MGLVKVFFMMVIPFCVNCAGKHYPERFLDGNAPLLPFSYKRSAFINTKYNSRHIIALIKSIFYKSPLFRVIL